MAILLATLLDGIFIEKKATKFHESGIIGQFWADDIFWQPVWLALGQGS
ncbi:hypothetical protein [Endozoicomonas sp. YOMI1]|nr:hypothetical protein [Endozoicomonas sp. YOMI1]